MSRKSSRRAPFPPLPPAVNGSQDYDHAAHMQLYPAAPPKKHYGEPKAHYLPIWLKASGLATLIVGGVVLAPSLLLDGKTGPKEADPLIVGPAEDMRSVEERGPIPNETYSTVEMKLGEKAVVFVCNGAFTDKTTNQTVYDPIVSSTRAGIDPARYEMVGDPNARVVRLSLDPEAKGTWANNQGEATKYPSCEPVLAEFNAKNGLAHLETLQSLDGMPAGTQLNRDK
jgi:hypothetical protein